MHLPQKRTNHQQKVIEFFNRSDNTFTVTNGGGHYELCLYDVSRDPRRRSTEDDDEPRLHTPEWGDAIQEEHWSDGELSDEL